MILVLFATLKELMLCMQNVESGVWPSDCEDAMGYHKSRRYNKSRIGR